MEQLLYKIREMLDEQATMEEFQARGKLSLYLAASYQFYLVQLLNNQFLLVKPQEEFNLSQIKGHMDKMGKGLGYHAVLLVSTLTNYKKKKLLSERMAFLSSDGQMYMPFLGLYLKKDTETHEKEAYTDEFPPSVQMVFLAILYGKNDAFCQEELSDLLGISHMTASRALEQLVSLKLLEYTTGGKTGRKKLYFCRDKKMFFQEGKQYLINPIKKSFFVCKVPDGVRTYFGGLSALSQKTLLGEPDHEILSAPLNAEKYLLPYLVAKEVGQEEHFTEIQLMKYDIGRLTDDNCVDPISTIYSIKDKDDRIEIAIDELMEEYTWYSM